MSMIIDKNTNQITIEVPNSEASIKAQHIGIADRTVGSYYMSEKAQECLQFLNNLNGHFYIDILRSYNECGKLFTKIIEDKNEFFFKSNLIDQLEVLKVFEWLMNSNDTYYLEVEAPTVNENKKYLKFDNENEYIKQTKLLVLGDFVNIVIKKFSTDVFIIYLVVNENYDNYKKLDKIK